MILKKCLLAIFFCTAASYAQNDCTFSDTFSNATGGGTHTNAYDDVETLQIDLEMVDNSFSVTVNGNTVHNSILEAESVRLAQGDALLVFPNQGNAVIQQPWLTNTEGLPRVRITIANGNVTLEGTRYVGSTTMDVMGFNDGSTFNPVNFSAGTNTISVVNLDDAGDDGILGTMYGTMACGGNTGGGNTGTSPWAEATNNNGITYDSGVGIGTDPQSAYRLAVEGKIRAREVKVDNDNWADYVFNTDYDLPTLEEVEKHIAEKGHLINIPSAEDVKANGVELGEMNKLLLEKIEELTLYILEQEKRIKHLEKTVSNK